MHSAATSSPLDLLSGSVPPGRFLSDGRYRVLLTAAGTGFSSFEGHALTRWRGDRIEDSDGFFFYLRDLDDGRFWSAGHQPVLAPGRRYEARWEPGRYEIAREDDGVEARLEVCVPPAAGAEIRRLVLCNRSGRRRRIELTTHVEVVLNDPAAHAAHPAFSKLFVQTEFAPAQAALLARRRPRARGETHPWMVHALLGGEGAPERETDRARFLGRCPRPGAPRALVSGEPLSGTTGNVLDPILSLRSAVRLEPGQLAATTFLLGAAPGRAEALALAERFAGGDAVNEAFAASGAQARAELQRLGLAERQAESFQALAAAMLYGHPGLRAAPEILARSHGPLADLVRLGVSPRRALAVLHAERPAAASLLPDLLRALRYWRALGLGIDLLVVHGDEVPPPLAALGTTEDKPLLLCCRDVAPDDLDRLDTAARLVVTETLPDLVQLDVGAAIGHAPAAVHSPGRPGLARCDSPPAAPSAASPLPAAASPSDPPSAPRDVGLGFFNGYGGFAADGREYAIRLRAADGSGLQHPPQPWINVLANEEFGCLVSESGAGCTWSHNSREHRLTPWSNDPVLDPHGEALYVRDEENGTFWSPLPGPAPRSGDYEMRHGFGYSVCRHAGEGLEHETTLFVPRRDPLRILAVRLTNRSGRVRRLSLFAYSRLVLGLLPEDSGRFVVTESDAASDSVLARNRWAGEFAAGITFAAVVAPIDAGGIHFTCDRDAFIGRDGSPARPAALCHAAVLDGRAGAGLDPCIAHQVVLEVAPGESLQVCFLLGEASGVEAARALVARYRAPGAIERALAEVREFWRHGLSGVEIATPSPALDLMVNGWLPYQNLACRIQSRSAFYQSGGAFGFRDQLQDAAALVVLWPERTRAQLLLHAAHQFLEGDVLHWWHPPLGRGLRTRFADDLLWLPYLTAFYVRTTGDWGILDETTRFLTARPLVPGEDEAYVLPADSGQSADLYAHCCRAIDRSLGRGAHGLPLFGTGDWNDGMNRVGREGRGESVWMGFFLTDILGEFVPLCERRGDEDRARRYRAHGKLLRAALDGAGWDGEWYRRGYYDDGTPLGSSDSDECRIDALAQAWAVISGVAPANRAAQAMDAVERQLISAADGVIRLLAPPFENTPHDPGYIRGYVPGVRENGGQYTHAALWVVRAMAELGRRDRAAELLEMLSPVNHSRTPEQVAVYQVEPYVIAADVGGAPPHVGRGGWTWYTGSAGWMYRVALESLLGFRPAGGDTLRLAPCIPDHWPEFTIRYRSPGDETRYEIHVANPRRQALGVILATLDGEPAPIEGGAARIPLLGDGRLHRVEIVLGPKDAGVA